MIKSTLHLFIEQPEAKQNCIKLLIMYTICLSSLPFFFIENNKKTKPVIRKVGNTNVLDAQ